MVPEASKRMNVWELRQHLQCVWRGRSAYNFEWEGAVGSAMMVGAVFVTGSFSKGCGDVGGR